MSVLSPEIDATFVGGLAGLMVTLRIVWICLLIVIHGAFAYAVWNDASKEEMGGEGAPFVHSIIWGLATLLGGVFVAVAYWILQHSALNPQMARTLIDRRAMSGER
jgi:hypothetical protein